MKSYLDLAVTLYGGIILDAIHRWPKLQSSLEKDLSYLLRACQTRGLQFFTVTMPQACKALDKALDAGDLSYFEAPVGFPFSKEKGPKLFRDLFYEIFDDSGKLRSDNPDPDAVFFLRQLLSCVKKYRLPCASSKTLEVVDEFFRIEDGLPRSHKDTWDSDVPEWRDRFGHPLWGSPEYDPSPHLPGVVLEHSDRLPWNTLRALARRVSSDFGDVEWWDLQPKHGPGVVSDGRDGLKYEFPHWPRKLGLWFPFDWFGSGLLQSDSLPSDREPPSRLIAVPKSQRGPRLICAEPIAHQWMQQSIWRWLEGAAGRSLLRGSICFRDQERQRKLALDSSRDGEHATIDLSSASDRLSTRLVEYIFQGHSVLDGLHASRTRLLSQDLSPTQPSKVGLRKFATMGSAVTFPVQTIVFCILTTWALRVHEGRTTLFDNDSLESDFQRVHVFGDDIIAPAHALETIKLVLHECGLKVNSSKTFGGSHFRESCGMDAFMGYDVTPAFVLQPYDGSPSSIASYIECANNLHKKGLWNAADAMMGLLPPAIVKKLRITGPNDGNFGLYTFNDSNTDHLQKRWDRDYHRWYTESLSVTSKVTKERGRDTASLSQYFFEDPNPDVIWSAGQVSGVRLRLGRTRVYE